MLFRVFGMFGLGAFFLAISPPLRESLVSQITAIAVFVDARGPWSYCALTMGALAAVMLWIHRASQHR